MTQQERVAEIIERYATALPAEKYAVGIRNVHAAEWKMGYGTREHLLEAVPRLIRANVNGCDINAAPARDTNGLSPYVMVDDVKRESIALGARDGYQPAAVIETSPRNYQAWYRHSEPLTDSVRRHISKDLTHVLEGDTGAVAAWHMGRLPGFTNRKAVHQDERGQYPWVTLCEQSGAIYKHAAEHVDDARNRIQQEAGERRAVAAARMAGPANLTIDDFRAKHSDLSKADWNYAMYALDRRVPKSEIAAAIRTRDLSHHPKNYAEYTIERAEKSLQQRKGASVGMSA
ncbi:MAG: hypothetical protein NVS9B4_00180 [Candidatus Acidiferrum sp.]